MQHLSSIIREHGCEAATKILTSEQTCVDFLCVWLIPLMHAVARQWLIGALSRSSSSAVTGDRVVALVGVVVFDVDADMYVGDDMSMLVLMILIPMM